MKKIYEAQIADLSEDDVAKIAGGESDLTFKVVLSIATCGSAAAF